MILNREDIKKHEVVTPLDECRLGNASYDLTIDQVITMDGSVKNDHYKLKSQEMVWVICKETFKMPNNVVGIAHVKTELTREGILSMNTGIIDPGYNGNISTLLINFGKVEKSISTNTIVLRVSFAYVNENNIDVKKVGINKNSYFENILKSTDNFDRTFLNMNAVQIRLSKVLFKRVIQVLAVLASLSATIILIDYVIKIFNKII
jgi:deoxycytidine triphosphate deaminase